MQITLCKKYSKKKKLAKKLLKKYPDAVVTYKSCIGMCKVCKTKPAAKVAGEKVKAKGIKKFLAKVEERSRRYKRSFKPL